MFDPGLVKVFLIEVIAGLFLNYALLNLYLRS